MQRRPRRRGGLRGVRQIKIPHKFLQNQGKPTEGEGLYLERLLFTVGFITCVKVNLYTGSGAVKYRSECAPNNGYFLIPLYDKV